jgi:hypothetical protein
MDMPTIFDILDRLAFLHGMPAVALLLSAAFIAIVAWDMRPVIVAVLAQYLLAGFLFVDVLDPRLAFVYALAGLFVTAILFITAWQTNWGRPPPGLTQQEATRLGLSRTRRLGRFTVTDRSLLRLVLAVVVVLVALWPARSPGLLQPVVPAELAYLEPAIVGLIGLGLAGLATSADPLSGGIGLLVFLTGFSLFHGFLDQSLAMTVALVVVQFVVALTVAYLAQARYLPADVLD